MKNNEMMIAEPETFSALVAEKLPEELDVLQSNSTMRTRCGSGMGECRDD